MSPRDARIDLRLSSEDKAVIEAAAAEHGMTVTDYVVASALGAGPVEYDARYALAREVVGSVADARAHARAAKRLLAYCEAGGIDPADHLDGDGDVWSQACVLATIAG